MARTAKIAGPSKGSAEFSRKYTMWATSDWSDMLVATKSDGNARTGFALVNGTLTECAVDGGTAPSAITLPAANVGAICAFRFTARADGGQTITFTSAAGDFYAAQTLDTVVHNFGDEFGSTPVKGHAFTSTVAVNAGAIKTIAATHNTLSIALTATDNQTNQGAELSFFCEKQGFWRLAFKGSEDGSGALNATFATSAV
tara:strand:- start:511 stop:1110 length:600 start_codon:yes stop_codon:yes gene_type:complete